VNRRDKLVGVPQDKSTEAAVRDSEREHPPGVSRENELDADSISALITFFKTLDSWDREAKKK
jgi:hypothetical protein